MLRNASLSFLNLCNLWVDLNRAQFLSLQVDMCHLIEEDCSALLFEHVFFVFGFGVSGAF